MKHIIPNLWFDKEAKEATELYTSLFPNSKVTNVTTLHNTPSGDTDIVSFQLFGQPFMAISAGPIFTLNPSVSFIVNFDPSKDKDAKANLDKVWEKLLPGGNVMMPLQEYPFSKHYGWIQDKYGLSWQLMLTSPAGEERPGIIPTMMFVGDNAGKAEGAIQFYLSVFKESPFGSAQDKAKMGNIMKRGAGMEPEKEGSVLFADFRLQDSWLAAMDSYLPHKFNFNEAISFIVTCKTQEEIDYYWEKLSAVPESEQCGWCKDKYGLSWQVVPEAMNEMMTKGTPEQVDRVTQAFLPMKKFDIATLQEAYDGK